MSFIYIKQDLKLNQTNFLNISTNRKKKLDDNDWPGDIDGDNYRRVSEVLQEGGRCSQAEEERTKGPTARRAARPAGGETPRGGEDSFLLPSQQTLHSPD